MATTEWSAAFEGTPAGNTSRKLGDDRIRELKVSIRERAQKGGHFMQDSAGAFVKDGRHVVGVGDGPTIYKSDATTELIRYTDTTMDLKAGMNITSVDGINGSALKANAATSAARAQAQPLTTVVALTSSTFAGPSLVLGTPKGQVMFWATVELEGVADNDMIQLEMQFDYLNTAAWSPDSQILSPVSNCGLWVPIRSAAAKKNVLYTFHGLNPMTTPSNGGTVNSRINVNNLHATASVIVSAHIITLLELRR